MKGFFYRRAIDAVRGSAEALFPKNQVGAPDWEQVRLVERTEEYLAMLPPEPRRLVLLLFIFTELVAPILTFRFGRYSRLDPEARRNIVRRFRGSSLYPIRLIGDSLKGVMTMIYMSHRLVVEHIGMFSVCEHPGDAFAIDVRLDALSKHIAN